MAGRRQTNLNANEKKNRCLDNGSITAIIWWVPPVDENDKPKRQRQRKKQHAIFLRCLVLLLLLHLSFLPTFSSHNLLSTNASSTSTMSIHSSLRVAVVFATAILCTLSGMPTADAFTSGFFGVSRVHTARSVAQSSSSSLQMRVVDIDNEAAFDTTIQKAGSALVVVDYSTTWCGPCKVIAPKFDELSDKYPDAVFLKVRSYTGPIIFQSLFGLHPCLPVGLCGGTVYYYYYYIVF